MKQEIIEDIREKYKSIIVEDVGLVKRYADIILYLQMYHKKIFGDGYVIKTAVLLREKEERIGRLYRRSVGYKEIEGINKEIEEEIERINRKINYRKENIFETLYEVEKYNGLGYRRKGIEIASPYLWSGSKHYKKGKFVEDGKYDGRVKDKQPGVAVVYWYIEKLGVV